MPSKTIFEVSEKISALLAEKDSEALQLKAQYESYWRRGLNFAVLAAITFAISTSVKFPAVVNLILTLAELIFLVLAFIIVLQVNNNKIKLKRISIRTESEQLRVMEALVQGGIPLKKLNNTLGSYQGVDPRIAALEEEAIALNNPQLNIPIAVEELTELITQQIEYHKGPKRILKFENKLKKAESWLKYLRWVFYLGAASHLFTVVCEWQEIDPFHITHFTHEFGLLCCTLVPPAYAWIEGRKYFEEWERFLGESLIMVEYFQNQLQKISNEPQNIVLYAHEIREDMDRENRTWKILMEFKSLNGI